MPTHPENLKKGDYVAVVKCLLKAPRQQHSYSPWSMFSDLNRPDDDDDDEVDQHRYNGRPQRVLGISYPFIAVTDGEGFNTIDLRVFRVQKLNKDYVRAMIPDITKGRDTQAARAFTGKSVVTEINHQEKLADPTACPKCGGKQIEKLKLGEKTWRLVCKECGNQGGTCYDHDPRPVKPLK